MKEKKHYETPATTLVRVELESDICAGSEAQPVHKDDSRHININKQDDGGAVDFTTSDNSWD